jgi:membrane protease YdiL (CAAX protease family)
VSDAPAEELPRAPEAPARPWGPLLAAAITTVIVTVASYRAPESYSATLVGVGFLASTWWLVLRHDEATVRAYGLSLGGLMEPARIDPRRLLRDGRAAAGWALLSMAVAFPPFAVGYRFFYACSLVRWALRCHPAHFTLHWPPSMLDDIGGQLVVIALPEEAFFRGYLQTAFDRVWAPRWRVLGADLGPGWLLSAAIFAVGHVITRPDPARLAVFFPALVFGWLRRRTGGIGAGVLFHASCNLFSAALGRGFHF